VSEHNFERLRAHILPLSKASEWSDAKNEWRLVGIELQEDWNNCPCGKEIKELCYIQNQLNGNKTHVGNVCVNRFIGIDTGNLFAGLRRIIEDETANANEDLIIHAYQLGYIHEREYQFLMQTRKKRILSLKQLEWKKKINRRIVHQTVVRNNAI
jgi:hypothetical protein